jgi:hypothetical protein
MGVNRLDAFCFFKVEELKPSMGHGRFFGRWFGKWLGRCGGVAAGS